ncbi:hypothetical protein JCM33374_g4038 [Metschnikowia sp. JCM 33374]|nr:hypothetical protein JCM33374_g4038 [Metschnikowia sp. JCM 33374]
MANNARSQRNFESDARSISSINSMKSIVSSASVYWMSFSFSKDPRVIQKDVKYLYSSFTKIPCLILTPRTKINSVSGYEEYPCDTSVPLKMFKNLQVLELVEYEPNEVYGWHHLSEKLRILIIRNTKVANLSDILYTLVTDDEHGRSSFTMRRQPKKSLERVRTNDGSDLTTTNTHTHTPTNPGRKRALTATSLGAPAPISQLQRESAFVDHRISPMTSASAHEPSPLPANKWFHLKQLTVTESSITQIPGFVFKPLSNLVKLNLSNNLLEDVPGGLEHLPQLKYLNLADNYITSLKNLPATLNQLITVNFNNNKIEDLTGVEHLSALEKIDLRRNKLENLSSLLPLVKQVSGPASKLNNIFISNNNLQRTYRADLFNLFNAAKPKNVIKIDDSRPGYFERAMLLDPDSAKKLYDKVMGIEKPCAPNPATEKKVEALAPEAHSPKTMQHKNFLNLHISPKTPENQPKGHKHSKSTGDVLESLASLNIQDLENSFANRKHSSVMTTASSTSTTNTSSAAPAAPPVQSNDSNPSSPSLRNIPKTLKPLLPNPNLCNQPHYSSVKMPAMARQLSSPMIHSNHNGSGSTIKSSSTLARIDLDSPSLTNLAPSVITPVQVRVEGFH